MKQMECASVRDASGVGVEGLWERVEKLKQESTYLKGVGQGKVGWRVAKCWRMWVGKERVCG